VQNSEARKHAEECAWRNGPDALIERPTIEEAAAFNQYVTVRQDLILVRVGDLMAELDELMERFSNLQDMRSK
jgi:hypothetical protein